MFIVSITPECAPVAKVGGLGDVVYGLAHELEIRGHAVEIILPKYDCMRYDQIYNLHETFGDLWVPFYDQWVHCPVYFGFVHGRKCYFIDVRSDRRFFSRGAYYGQNDDDERFALFSRAALEFLHKAGKQPDIIHCHDWQTGLVPVLLFEMYRHLGMTHPRVCYTLHNLRHQGVTGEKVLRATGLHRPEYFFHQDRLQDNFNHSAINLMKGGIVYSNFVTTVSPRYAWEIQNTDLSYGLGRTLEIHGGKLGGVLNGLDYDVWNPETDPHIPHNYTVGTLDTKYKNKEALRRRLLLRDAFMPIVAYVGRLDHQKGVELIRDALFYSLANGSQFVLLGSSPERATNNYFLHLKHHLNDNPDCHLEIGFDEDLSHLIYAGADIFIVPSLFEPCGLTQMIALRYGTVPVVRSTGGLMDTVFDANYSDRPYGERNGFVFQDFNYQGLESAMSRAIALWHTYPRHFRALMVNGMKCDYSWNNSGEKYLEIFEQIREK